MIPKKFHVQWTLTAENELKNILDYIAQNNPQNAKSIFKKIKVSCSKLTSFPFQGRIVPELKAFGIINYHEIIVVPWRIIYRVENKMVFILTIIDSRKSFEDLIFERFINE